MKQTPKQIHSQYDKFDDTVKVSINHQYMKQVEAWKFAGYRCRYCDNGFKFASSMSKHKKTCKVLNKLKDINNADTKTNT